MKTALKRAQTVVAGVIVIGTLAACGPHRYHNDPEKRINAMMEEVSDELELNSTQQEKLAALKRELLGAATQIRSDRDSVHATVGELLAQPTLDQTRLVSLITQKSAALNERAPVVVAALAGFYDSLTPEQQGTLRDEVKGRHRSCWFH